MSYCDGCIYERNNVIVVLDEQCKKAEAERDKLRKDNFGLAEAMAKKDIIIARLRTRLALAATEGDDYGNLEAELQAVKTDLEQTEAERRGLQIQFGAAQDALRRIGDLLGDIKGLIYRGERGLAATEDTT